MKINCGCSLWHLEGYINIDMDPECKPDMIAQLPPIAFEDGSIEAVYAGHFLEHLDFEVGAEFLKECYRVLAPGGTCCIVVPDTREVIRVWLCNIPSFVVAVEPEGHIYPTSDLDTLCECFFYGRPGNKSKHLWSYEKETLGRAMHKAGFRQLHEIDRYADPRLASAAWFQIGVEGVKE